jgi:hypothetical protein
MYYYFFVKNSEEAQINTEFLFLSDKAKEHIGFSYDYYSDNFIVANPPLFEIDTEICKVLEERKNVLNLVGMFKSKLIGEKFLTYLLNTFCFGTHDEKIVKRLKNVLKRNNQCLLLIKDIKE